MLFTQVSLFKFFCTAISNFCAILIPFVMPNLRVWFLQTLRFLCNLFFFFILHLITAQEWQTLVSLTHTSCRHQRTPSNDKYMSSVVNQSVFCCSHFVAVSSGASTAFIALPTELPCDTRQRSHMQSTLKSVPFPAGKAVAIRADGPRAADCVLLRMYFGPFYKL